MENLFLVLVAIAIAIGVFLLCRELLCWYWKINKHIKLMEENNELLRMIVAQNSSKTKENEEASHTQREDEIK